MPIYLIDKNDVQKSVITEARRAEDGTMHITSRLVQFCQMCGARQRTADGMPVRRVKDSAPVFECECEQSVGGLTSE